MRNVHYVITLGVCGLLLLSACKKEDTGVATLQAKTSSTGDHPLPELRLEDAFAALRFDQPLFLSQIPGHKDNWYVLEKAGRIQRLSYVNGRWEKQVYLDITARVDASRSESGLLGMSFDPDFALKPFIYLSYTAPGRGTAALVSHLSRFRSSGIQFADPGSEESILVVEQPYANHNGGHIAFSPNKFLFYGLGDGGSGGDPQGNGQNPQTLLGALLRLDVHAQTPYTTPVDNPFAQGGGRKEIYAWGLRNPWRWSFDRTSGELWLADVGQNDWEEVNIVKLGDNLGWNGREGKHCYEQSLCNKGIYVDPVLEYDHSEGNCSVTGGYVYRGEKIKALQGVYLYADYCSGKIWAAVRQATGAVASKLILSTDMNIASFAEDNQGEIFVLDLGGRVKRLVQAPVQAQGVGN